MPGKKQKGGNKRGEINAKKDTSTAAAATKEDLRDALCEIRDTECIEDIIQLTKHENEYVRLKAAQQMCPCQVKHDQPEFWERLFELAEDEDEAVRAQVLHNMCDGSPPGYEDRVMECLEIFNRDPCNEIRRKAHKVIGNYMRTGDWNIL